MTLEEKLLRIDFRFHEVKYELWALEEYLNTVERQLPLMEDEEVRRTTERLREQGLEDDEAERSIATQELFDRVENILPRFFRGPILVSLCAVYQSATEEIAEYIRKEKGYNLSLKDLYGSGDFDRVCKYFDLVLAYPLFTSEDVKSRLEILMILRNVLAHGNGRLSAMKPDRRKQLEKNLKEWKSLGVSTYYTDTLLFSETFLRETFSTVAGSLRDLMERVSTDF